MNNENEMLEKWLGENVVSFPKPRLIMISDIEFDWESFSGQFSLILDGYKYVDFLLYWCCCFIITFAQDF